MKNNKVNKESKNTETARDKGVNSTGLLYKKTSLTVDELLEEFPFQCSCGAKHLFWYIENKEGIRFLTLNQAYSKGN